MIIALGLNELAMCYDFFKIVYPYKGAVDKLLIA